MSTLWSVQRQLKVVLGAAKWRGKDRKAIAQHISAIGKEFHQRADKELAQGNTAKSEHLRMLAVSQVALADALRMTATQESTSL